ncbi:alcohol dehydrogenase AdhP [Leifsonia kafniensis]|uniref:alcohol dehydrogenase n=1 Tax=Leifsonia kafniensis TaxID=475957 RepID=A0ABP7KSM8_9MICO
MKAWHFSKTGEPLELVDIAAPTPGPGEVAIRVRAAGLCHSVIGLMDDEVWMKIANLPIVPGDEIAGEVTSLGEGVTAFHVGQRVVVWPRNELFGYLRNGGFAEHVIANEGSVIPIPDGMSFEIAAAISDSGQTSHNAVVSTGMVKAGEKVGVIGVGGLGLTGAKLVKLLGAELFVAEINEEAWQLATDAGASRVVRSILELKDEELDVIIDFAGMGVTTAEAIEAVKSEGRVVLVGMGRSEATINTHTMIMKQLKLLSVLGGVPADITAMLGYVDRGELSPQVELITFDEIPAGLDRLRNGDVRGRLVAVFGE